MNAKLQQIVDAIPVISGLLDERAYITVLDAEGIVQGYNIPKGETPKVRVGDFFVDPSGAYKEVLRNGIRKVNYLPAEVMGEPFQGILMPIKDGGTVVGVIAYTHAVGEFEHVRDITEEFHKSMEDMTDSISEVISGMENMFVMLSGMNEHTKVVDSDVKSATGVIQKLSKNASRSNILALNASIEAARSGEAGRGFNVVASEMGKLANDSGVSAKEIKDILDAMSGHIADITESIIKANNASKGYLDGVSGIKEKLESTLTLAEELKKVVK